MLFKKGIKTICFTLLATLLLSSSICSTEVTAAPESTFSVYSKEYPNAYIITEVEKTASPRSTDTEVNLGTVTATVFVEENYGWVNGEYVIIESRLLSKEEVDTIGIDNFETLNPNTRASNSRGKLTITFSGTYKTSGNSVSSNLTGNAKWSGFNTIYSATNNPAGGEDYCGFAWSGEFSASNSRASATMNIGVDLPVSLAASSPNAGRVWSFYEYDRAGDEDMYMNNADFSTTLSKNTMTGNGNTAEAVMQYIHTYEAAAGSISFSPTGTSVGVGFSLSNVSKQWSIACTVTGIPY